MQATETKTEGLKREFDVVVPANEIDERINKRLEELKGQVNLPGFRPGKIPASMMKKRFGASVMGEVLEAAVGEATKQVLTDNAIRPAIQPQIEVKSFDEGKDLEYTIAVEVLPEIEKIDFATLELERMVTEPNEDDLKEALDRLAAGNKTSEPITGKRKSKSGDIVVIDFVGKVDGEEFAGGKADAYELELGSGSFIPGFEEQLTGAKAGDHVEVNVKFPDEYGAAELAGKDALFEVDVKEIRETTPGEINDELAKKAGLEDLDALKKAIGEEHDRELKNISRTRLKRNLLDMLSERYDFEVPEGMLKAEGDAIWAQFEEQRKAGRLDEAEFEGKSDDDIKAEFSEIAERRVRLALVLAEVGRENELQIGQDEINRALMNEARQYQGQEKLVFDYYKNNPEAMEALRGPLMEDKVVDFILELATISDRTVSREELLKDPDADDAEKVEEKPKKKRAAKKTKED